MIIDPSVGASAPATAELGQQVKVEVVQGVTNAIVLSTPAVGLPEMFLWLQQISGLAGCQFTPMVSYSVVGAGAVWIPLTQPQIVPLGTPPIPIYFRDRIPGATQIAIRITTPAGAANSVFDAVIGAGG